MPRSTDVSSMRITIQHASATVPSTCSVHRTASAASNRTTVASVLVRPVKGAVSDVGSSRSATRTDRAPRDVSATIEVSELAQGPIEQKGYPSERPQPRRLRWVHVDESPEVGP